MSSDGGDRKLGWVLVLSLLLLAVAELVVRGPVRFAPVARFNDFISPYIQSKAWLNGIDPYSPADLVALWPPDEQHYVFLHRELADGTLVMKRGIPTAYPPTSLVVLAPIAWMPWHFAHGLWLAMSVASCGLMVWAVALLAGFRWDEKRTYIFAALALALAPFQTGLATGSIVIVVVGLCVLAVLAASRGRELSAAFLFAAAIALKPQIGLPFLVFYAMRRKWRVVACSLIVVAVLGGLAILRLRLGNVPWIESYRTDNRVLFAHGSLGDFTEANPMRFGLLNLQVLLYTFVPDRTDANLGALVVGGLLSLCWLILEWRRADRMGDDSANQLLDLGAIAVISILPLYHRLYDASLLIFPLAWSLAALRGPAKKLAAVALVLILVFLVPGGSALEWLIRRHHFTSLQGDWWWTRIVMPHQIWALLALSVLLLAGMRHDRAINQA